MVRRRGQIESKAPLTTNMSGVSRSNFPAERDEGVELKPLVQDNSSVALNMPQDSSDNGEQLLNKTVVNSANNVFNENPEFFMQALKFLFCFCGLQASYLTWGYMQELIMTTEFKPTERVPDGKFPSAAFCVFSNRFLAIIVAMVAVKLRHGAVFSNNAAPLLSFTPCAFSNTMSSWSQYASLKYVSFPVQTVFKSSKVIPVMLMGKLLKGTKYTTGKYCEALLITIGVAIFSLSSRESTSDTTTELVGYIYLITYISFDSFTSQWQDKIYQTYGKANVDPYQMMLGVNSSAIMITTSGLIISGDFPIVIEFLKANPSVFQYNVITAITSASGQLCIYYTIKEFGPIVFTIIMTTRQMISICLSAIIFGHAISLQSFAGALVVFSVLFYQIRNRYYANKQKNAPKPSEVRGSPSKEINNVNVTNGK